MASPECQLPKDIDNSDIQPGSVDESISVLSDLSQRTERSERPDDSCDLYFLPSLVSEPITYVSEADVAKVDPLMAHLITWQRMKRQLNCLEKKSLEKPNFLVR